MYIYADILIITNIYIDFLLIKCTQYITHSSLKTVRSVTAAVLGSLFSLTIFLPHMNAALMTALKLAAAVVVVYTAFGIGTKEAFFKRLFIFFLISFVFAGAGTWISTVLSKRLIISRNGVIYADFSPSALIITSVAAYVSIAVYRRFSDYSYESGTYSVIISDRGKTISLNAIADTGNSLRDCFTGKPVIVCPIGELSYIYDDIPCGEEIIGGGAAVAVKWRLIPYTTVSGRGMIPIIAPRDICIKNEDTGEITRADVYIGAAGESGPAVFHPKILI